ncbi:MAG TPA: DNA polymerase III subunit gamma/tau [Polyangiaceae bacterium]|nr:DNA polymerase III subunit gamma/tau [Polyangiaceae bacterium]
MGSGMSYVVLARKWRPMSFEDLVGQGHVSQTLGNAIKAGRVAHAFLFTGVRGVGKTTSARILAKALNCMGTKEAPHDGPTVTPCLKCPACTEIAAGTDVDVREIDGASYNGVDEVRKLQDSLPYRPARDRHKIFIVDEVHMLSQSAWNAFLKTLEEPPPHVKFIFATTEVHKVPVTILSRVQRFDFKLIPTQLIAKRLRHVLDTEKIPADDTALAVVARQAAGSMRDAMSLLDQVIAWNDQGLTGEGVARVLGVASRQVLHDLAAALVDGNAARALGIVGELSNQGYDVSVVARDTLSLLRDLVVAKVCAPGDTGDLLDLADEERKDVSALAGRAGEEDLLRLHQGFSASYDDVVRSSQPRAALEMLLVRLARRPPLVPVDDLIGRLLQLEKRLGGAPRGGPPGPAPGPGRPPPGRPDPRPGSPADRGSGRESRTAPSPAAAPAERAEEPPRRAEPPGFVPPPSPFEERSAPSNVPPPLEARAAPSNATPSGPSNAVAAPQPSATPSGPSNAVAAPQPSAPRTNGATPADPETLRALVEFRAVVERVRLARPELAAFLNHAVVVSATPERLVLGLEAGSVFERNVKEPASLAVLARAAHEHFGRQTEIVFESTSGGGARATVSATEEREREERKQAAKSRAKAHPRIAQAAEILGARLKDIQVPED